MATIPAPPPPVYGPNGERLPQALLRKSPVKELHSIWQKAGASQREKVDLNRYAMLLNFLLDAMLIHPNCLDSWLPLKRPCKCTCMKDSGLGHGSIELKQCIGYLITFAKMAKDQQQMLVIQWIRYSEVMKQFTVHKRHTLCRVHLSGSVSMH